MHEVVPITQIIIEEHQHHGEDSSACKDMYIFLLALLPFRYNCCANLANPLHAWGVLARQPHSWADLAAHFAFKVNVRVFSSDRNLALVHYWELPEDWPGYRTQRQRR